METQLKTAGVGSLPDLKKMDFVSRKAKLEAFGVFTLAGKQTDEFENLRVVQESRAEAEEAVGDSKARQGRYIAERSPCPPLVGDLLDKVHTYLGSLGPS